ncbi:hypothetical protein ZYGM_003316 [Zygosaccharomyces mellis]|uniref:Protein GIS4 n=1 Tax=Zygosaccharomyces mellis TaxID=42258 RepID=A0A4C2E0Y4_9SACH|nr:hypothetical protein ZYGM_003316 [Zygosaccharomyces mellis]
MHKSIRIGDYFGNDNNGLWSWYLANIRNGDFEELTRNQLKHALFKRFLRTYLDPKLNERKDTRVLIVSIPEDVHRDITLLEYFLGDYLNLDNMEIKKLTTSRVYNHENHYVVMDKENNFENSDFLNHASTNIQSGPRFTGNDLAGTAIAEPMEQEAPSTDSENVQLKQGTELLPDTEGEERSLVFDFTHRDHHLARTLPASDNNQESMGKSQLWNHQQQQLLREYDTSNDEMASIDSCNFGSGSSRVVESFKGEPLTLTTTRTDDFSSSGEYDGLDSNSSSSETDLSSFESCSLVSVLPSISIADSFGHFRLVLQSVLFITPTSNEIFTAIRQSNNKPTKADVDDDWLLYDSQFSMHNLQMLTLQDLSELNKGCPKILFYSLVEVIGTPSLEDTNADSATVSKTAPTFLNKVPTSTSVSCEPRVFFPPNVNPADTSGCCLTKGNTNSSTLGHRSIVTTNSAADLMRQSIESNTPVRKYGSTAKTYKSHNSSRPADFMERTKSTPLPTALKTISGSDSHRNRRWWSDFKRRGQKNAVRRFADDKGCIIC